MWRPFRKLKTKDAPSAPVTWISKHVLDLTTETLQQSGSPTQAHEGIVYWAGRRFGNERFVTTCVAPQATTTRGSFVTSSETNAKVVMYLASAGLELFGQVHSHPGRYVDHSDGDDENALMPYEGFLSIVVPNYALQGMCPLNICGVHVFSNSRFRRLNNSDVATLLRIIEDFTDLRA